MFLRVVVFLSGEFGVRVVIRVERGPTTNEGAEVQTLGHAHDRASVLGEAGD